jgi:hypothetical protein
MDCINTHSLTLGKILRVLGVVALVSLLVWYVHFQARNFLTGPTIDLDDTYGVLHHEQSIVLSGTAHNIVKLTLNGREIHTNEEGSFAQTLVLEHGYSIMTLEAQDRFGRITSLQKEFVYTPS